MNLDTKSANEIGLINDFFGENFESFLHEVQNRAEILNLDKNLNKIIEAKKMLLDDKYKNNLQIHREEELKKMHENFFGQNSLYHDSRKTFVFKM